MNVAIEILLLSQCGEYTITGSLIGNSVQPIRNTSGMEHQGQDQVRLEDESSSSNKLHVY